MSLNLQLEAQALALFEDLLQSRPADLSAWLAKLDIPQPLAQAVTELWLAHQQSGAFLSSPARSPQQEIVGNWRVLDRISDGGMGSVYRAERADGTFSQQVAIKFIRLDKTTASDALRQSLVRRFETERQILARLNHANIARIIDGGQSADGQPYLVMEYVEGLVLTRYARANKPALPALLRLMIKVCEAVGEAHRHLIVHRDLKPDNILVTADGEPKLLDFGIAKILADESPANTTRTGMGAMTPAYASPEQIRLQPITTASDIYSLGVLLYELLSGQRPYELYGLSPADTERLVCTTSPQRPSAAVENTPLAERVSNARQLKGDLDNIVLKAMHKDPRHRYPSAADLAQDIGLFLAGHPVRARGDALGYRVGKFVRRHRLAMAATLAVVLVLAGAGWHSLQKSQEVQKAAESALQMNAFLVDVLANADPFTAGRETTLKEALYATEEQIADRFADKPLLEADVRHTIGYAALSRNDLDQAERLLNRAAVLRQQNLPAGTAPRTASLVALAWLALQRGEVAEAGEIYTQTLDEIENGPDKTAPISVTALNDYGLYVMNQVHDLEKARHLFATARDLAAAVGSEVPPAELASIINNQGRVEELLGNPDRALALYQSSYELALEVLPASHPNLAIYLNNRGQLAFYSGSQEQGLELLEQSLAMRRASFSGDHPSVWLGLLNLSTLSARAGQSQRALALADQATAMARRLHAEPHLNLAISLIRGAARHLEAGDGQAAAMIAEAGLVLDQLQGDHGDWRDELAALERQSRGANDSDNPMN